MLCHHGIDVPMVQLVKFTINEAILSFGPEDSKSSTILELVTRWGKKIGAF